MTSLAEWRRQIPDGGRGREIFDITPVIVGGSPTDPANKTLLTRSQHIEAVRYWNKTIAEIRANQK